MMELKPCPFCGHEPQITICPPPMRSTYHNHPFVVRCYVCDLLFGWDIDYGGEFDTEEEAAAAWNRRV